MFDKFHKIKYKVVILFVLITLSIFSIQAQGFLTDFENLRNELGQRGLEDFTKAYNERVKIFDAWDAIRDEISSNDLVLSRVVLGIMDTGADLSNGRHSEFTGVDFSGSDPSSFTDEAPADGSERGHGTQVAGIIGANNLSSNLSNNYQFPQMNGILSGINNNYTLVLSPRPVRRTDLFFRLLGFLPFFTTGFEKSLQIMPENSLVNMSFGAAKCSEVNSSNRCISDVRFEQVKKFYEEGVEARNDLLFVMSAGNAGIDAKDHLPGGGIDTINTITVSATNFEDGRATFPGFIGESNFGRVDIAAPGENIYAPSIRNKGTANLGGVSEEVNYVTNFSGTSASAPFVTGVAGLLKAINPDLTPAEIKNILISTGDPITTDKPIGPRLNAHSAVCHEKALNCDGRGELVFEENFDQYADAELTAQSDWFKISGGCPNGTNFIGVKPRLPGSDNKVAYHIRKAPDFGECVVAHDIESVESGSFSASFSLNTDKTTNLGSPFDILALTTSRPGHQILRTNITTVGDKQILHGHWIDENGIGKITTLFEIDNLDLNFFYNVHIGWRKQEDTCQGRFLTDNGFTEWFNIHSTHCWETGVDRVVFGQNGFQGVGPFEIRFDDIRVFRSE